MIRGYKSVRARYCTVTSCRDGSSKLPGTLPSRPDMSYATDGSAQSMRVIVAFDARQRIPSHTFYNELYPACITL
jgi:hypothetical protein